MHTRGDAGGQPAGDAEQLDAVAELGCVGDVERGDGADALDMHRLEGDRAAEGDGGEDGQFMRRVDAVDIERGVAFGVAQRLRFGQHFFEFAAALAHHGQDVVAGAVEDAGDGVDVVAGQALPQGFDDRDAAGDRGLEAQGQTAALSQSGEAAAMHREQRLVGGDDGFAGSECCLHEGPGRAFGAADQLDHHVHRGIVREGDRVVVPLRRR